MTRQRLLNPHADALHALFLTILQYLITKNTYYTYFYTLLRFYCQYLLLRFIFIDAVNINLMMLQI